MDVAAHFACLSARITCIVHQTYLLGTFNKAVKVVCPYAILMFVGREGKATAEVVGDKRVGTSLFGEYAFVHRKHNQTVKIERTRLQHSHNLQTRKRLAMKGNCNHIRHPPKEFKIGVDTHLHTCLAHHLLHTVYGGKVVEYKLLLHILRTSGGVVSFVYQGICFHPFIEGLQHFD